MDQEIKANQIAAARVLLGITQIQLADLSGISPSTVKRIESGLAVTAANRSAVRAALAKAGVEFIAENGGGPGVRLRKSAKGVEEILQQIDALENKISSMLAPTEPSPEAGMNIMRKAVAKNDLTKLKNRRTRITRRDRSK